MKITISYYGVFRNFGRQRDLHIGSSASVQDIKGALVTHLGLEHQALIEASVLASETDILPEGFVLEDDCTLSIFPPVCGG